MFKGLSNIEVIESRKNHGSNKIIGKSKNSFIKLFLETLGDPIIKILLIALAIKVLFLFKDFDWYETVGIVIAILIASLISTISEYGSEAAFEKLQAESSKIKCKVIRNEKVEEVAIDDIVVDDIVLLQTGDKIPADGEIIKDKISVDESSLNGETREIEKDATLKSSVYRGTVVYSGEAYMKVKKVGNETFYGQMAKELQEKTQDSPLKLRLHSLAKIISKIGYAGALLVSLSYLFSKIIVQNEFQLVRIISTLTNFPEMFTHILYALTLSVTIIVVAVPEGLPMMITLVLSSNMKRMLKSNVLVRKLVGIETAGSLNILFTDKTGTLTKGKLEVIGLSTGNNREYHTEYELQNYEKFHYHLKNACIYNNASYKDENNKPVGGNITDRAILDFIKTPNQFKYQKLKILSFDSKNKYSSTTIDSPIKTTYIKGAPEKILPACKEFLSTAGIKVPLRDKNIITNTIENKTRKGIRAIALAYKEGYSSEKLENLILIGIIYIKDDVRKEAIEGIKLVQKAGIKVVMITGDSKETAMSIGNEIGLLSSKEDIILTSDELQKMSDEELKKVIPKLKIVARSLPQDKSRLVRLSEELGLVTGMTGDGVNDAPALKKADVGFAMGSGTEVCKEAGDIVILDDNFLSI